MTSRLEILKRAHRAVDSLLAEKAERDADLKAKDFAKTISYLIDRFTDDK